MNYRINTTVITIVGLLIFSAILILIYISISAHRDTAVTDPKQEEVQEKEEKNEMIVTAKHQYKNDVHTIVGVATVPTPCHRLITEPYFASDKKLEVTVRFSTLLEGEACPSQPHDTSFSVSFKAVEAVTIGATWNGNPIRLNLVPVGPDEPLDTTTYIKG